MCIAIPMKILKIEDNKAIVEIGDQDGSTTIVDVTMVEANVGDYVIANTGYAIRVLDELEAKETLELWDLYQKKMKQ